MKTKKNDYSVEYKKYINKQTRNKWIIVSSQIFLLVLIFGLWELLTQLNVLNPFIFSSPTRIVNTITNLFKTGNLLYHIGITLYEAILSFVIATAVGFLIAVWLWWSEWTRKILEPYFIVLNSLPKIALGPIIIVWFGLGTKSIIVMAFLIIIVIAILNLLNAFLSCDENKILLLKSMGATKFQILIKVVIPNAMPNFISVLKINVGMTWVGTIMGEYLESKAGLGYLIVYGGQIFKLDLVMSSTVILCVLAALMYGIVAIVEKHFSKKYK